MLRLLCDEGKQQICQTDSTELKFSDHSHLAVLFLCFWSHILSTEAL